MRRVSMILMVVCISSASQYGLCATPQNAQLPQSAYYAKTQPASQSIDPNLPDRLSANRETIRYPQNQPAGQGRVTQASWGEAPLPALPVPNILPLSLETALQWTLSSNPDLITQRQNLPVSAEAIEIARRFPTSLNPTVAIDFRPWVFDRPTGNGIEYMQTLVSVSWMQPIELGHRRSYRTAIAQAEYSLTRWQILQAELLALVQSYRLHQTAVYRREKLRVSGDLNDFNIKLLDVLKRQMEANQVPPSDVVLAEVETQLTSQERAIAEQEYVSAVADLRQQIGLSQHDGWFEPLGSLKLPGGAAAEDETALVQAALACRPEVRAARAELSGSEAAVCLAKADMIPIFSVGPVYEKDESGVCFYGVGVSSPIPVLNLGRSNVWQKEAENHRSAVALRQVEQKITVQVKAALVRWQQVQRLVQQTDARTESTRAQAAKMERLFQAGQADLVKLFEVRRRLIEATNSQLDATWQATQSYADLLGALGATPLLGSMPDQSSDAPAALPDPASNASPR
jgi:outer membrane protein, heavy metal efflux system